MDKVSIISFVDEHRSDLKVMLEDFSKEVFKVKPRDVQVDDFIRDYGWGLFIIKVKEEAIGFIADIYEEYYKMKPPALILDFCYIKKEYKRSQVVRAIAKHQIDLAVHYNLPLESHFASIDSKAFGKRGEEIYTAYSCSLEELKNIKMNLRKEK